MIDALRGENMDDFGQGPDSSHDAEEGEEHVPSHQNGPHLHAGPLGHVGLSAKDEQ